MASDFPGEEDSFDPVVLEQQEKTIAQQAQYEEDKVVRLLRRRKEAYAAVFKEGNRSQADIDIVLFDLMYFCRATVPSFDLNDGIHADILSRIKEGRREVFLRVRDFASLDFDALLIKYTNALTK